MWRGRTGLGDGQQGGEGVAWVACERDGCVGRQRWWDACHVGVCARGTDRRTEG